MTNSDPPGAAGRPEDRPESRSADGGRSAAPPHPDPDAPPPGGWFGLRVLPAGWMRGLVATLTALATIVIALGDLASAWVVLILPITVGALVAYHEVLERLVRSRAPQSGEHPENR